MGIMVMKNLLRALVILFLTSATILATPEESLKTEMEPSFSLAGGLYHAVVIKSDGTIWAWGCNEYGQLGDGTTITRYTPVPVKGLDKKNIIKTVAGHSSTYFLATDGTVWAVGSNNYGQLGDGTKTTRTIPVQVQGLDGKFITDIAAASHSAYFLDSDGSVWAVGYNEYGQLGDGTETDRSLPVPVKGLSDKKIIAISAGDRSGYFLASDGSVWAVGHNGYYQLGDGSGSDQNIPVQVQGLDGKTIISINGGERSAYFLALDGTVWAVGFNNYGQLGDGTTETRKQPVQVQGLSTKFITAVAGSGGDYAAYFLASDGTVWSVGHNHEGQLGDGSLQDQYLPVKVQGLDGENIIAIDAGLSTAYYMTSEGKIWATGNNEYGQLGDGSSVTQTIPVQSTIDLLSPENKSPLQTVSNNSSLKNFNDFSPVICAGDYHALALESDGTVWAWGTNEYGQLGDGTTKDRRNPVLVQGLNQKKITAIAAGQSSSYFLASDGTVWAVGNNNNGQLGDGSKANKKIPVQVQGLENQTIIAIAADDLSAYFLASDGTVWAVGDNEFGQLGDGTTTDRSLPVLVQGLHHKTIVAIAAGKRSVYFLASDGTVWSLGYNNCGQLGIGIIAWRKQPVQVQGLKGKNIISIDAGYYNSYFVASDGTVWAAGNNEYGQLGDGTTIDKALPVQVQGLNGKSIRKVFAGVGSVYFLASDGTVWSVGHNNHGQLGDGGKKDRTVPVQVQKLSGKQVIGVAPGLDSVYFAASDGTIWAGGFNQYGQLGDGTFATRLSPVQILELKIKQES